MTKTERAKSLLAQQAAAAKAAGSNPLMYDGSYTGSAAVGTERSGSGSWTEDITVAKGDLIQIYQHDSNTNYPHSVTAFNILVSSVYGGTVLL